MGHLAKTRFGGTVFEMEILSDRPGWESQTYFLTVGHKAILLTSEPLFFLLSNGDTELTLYVFYERSECKVADAGLATWSLL